MWLCGGAGWLGLVALVLGPAVASSRYRRQINSWLESYDQSAWNSMRGYHGVASLPVSVLGSVRGYPGSPAHSMPSWGSSRQGSSVGQPTQLQQPPNSPINVQCGEDKMVVTVERDFYGNGRLVKASDLSLGLQSCKPGPQSTDTMVVFEIGLQECGNSLQMTPDWLIYNTDLTFNPTPRTQNVPITRTSPAVVPIQCYYPRHGNVSSKAIKPTWIPFSTTVSSEERLSFSLRLMTDDWSAPRSSSVFQLGDIFSIEASVDTLNHAPMILFIDSCMATMAPDVNSNPRYEMIAFNGCLMDGKQEDSSSAFRSPRLQVDKLQFTVDAFRFIRTDVSTIFVTCLLRTAATTQVPDPMNKACSYSKTSNSWSAVEGSGDICRCCDTGNCVAPTGQSRRWGSVYGRPRGIGRREASVGADSEQRHVVATLGPLLVIGADQSRTLAVTESSPVELWVLVAVGCLSFLVVLVCVMIIGKLLKRPRYPDAIHK